MSEQAVLATSNPELERQNTPTVGDIRQQYKKNKDHDPLIFVSARGGAYVGDLDRAISIAG